VSDHWGTPGDPEPFSSAGSYNVELSRSTTGESPDPAGVDSCRSCHCQAR
jgi:hypothetical protein